MCENKTCDTNKCSQRHPRECRYYREYNRCKFNPCKFKHILQTSTNADIEKLTIDVKNCNEQLEVIETQLKKMEEIITKKEEEINDPICTKASPEVTPSIWKT